MSERKAAARPVAIEVERIKHVLTGAVQSRSNPERLYQPRILLEADCFCTCPSMTLRNVLCVHIKELLRQLSPKDFRRWVKDSATVRHEEDQE